MAYIGKTPTPVPLTSSDIASDIINSTHIGDTAISGFDALATAPADTDEFLISDAGVLKRLDASLIGGGGYEKLLETNITSSTASVSLDGYFTSTYDIYRVYFFNVVPVDDNVAFRSRFLQGGSVISASNYKYLVNGSYSSASSVSTDQQSGSGASYGVLSRHGIDNQNVSAGENGYYDIFNPLSTDHQKYANGQTWDSLNNNGFIASHNNTMKYEGDTNAISGINFFFGSGNIATGTFVLYGLKK